MFSDTKAFSAFAVDDLAQARNFYGETLGIGVSG
jgi:extradiol dioxygenase family protein